MSAGVNPRLGALCELMLPGVRENAGLHLYDGHVADLSPAGVAGHLAAIAEARRVTPPERDPFDEGQLRAFEDAMVTRFDRLAEHRRNPYVHLDNLDLAGYDREYAPAEAREEARRRHLAAWPDAVDNAIESLDSVPGPVAKGLLGAARGLAADVGQRDADREVAEAALAAHARFVGHLEGIAASGDPDVALGADGLQALLSASEAMPVDLGRLAARADAERDRLLDMLQAACRAVDPDAAPADLIATLLRDHPDAGGVLDEARAQVAEVVAFTREHDLVPNLDGECLVGPAPPSRRWAMAMMAWAGPYEPEAPSWYHVTPPDPSWPPEEQEEWLSVFSRTTLPAITVHEVAPGHFAHGRALRRVGTDVRRMLQSEAFVEGWAHYAEELCLEEGFRADDPRYRVGVAIEALIRVTRLACSIGVHSRTMSLDDAVGRFERDGFLLGPAARSEAVRSTFDPTYGRYTWGKLEILTLRDEAIARWGRGYSHTRLHAALLALGSPCLGLMGRVLDESS
ncbi:MAG: hypothetical protein JWO37_1450 [Acidimicrobiales bacterium]|nr:hypothetical protein [Acidimicrobiales bacterium]